MFYNPLLSALADTCPCVAFQTEEIVVDDIRLRTQVYATLPDPKPDEHSFCDCVESPSGRCTLLHDLLQMKVFLRFEYLARENGREKTEGKLSRVQWNPAYTGQDAQQGSTPTLVLVHEMTHAWSDRWSPGIGTASSTGLIMNEVYAVRGANQIGKEIGVPGLRPRTRYGSKQVPDPEQAMFPQCSAQTCAQWYEELENGGWGNFWKTGRD